MRAEIVGVGTELLLGQIANTNARWIGERCSEIGIDVLFHQAVGVAALRRGETYFRINGRWYKMLWTITVILLVLWVLGLVSGSAIGAWVHILLVLAVISLIFALMRRGGARVP